MVSKSPSDDVKINIACPQCGKKIKETITRLDHIGSVTCPFCLNRFSVQIDKAGKVALDKKVEETKQSIIGAIKKAWKQ